MNRSRCHRPVADPEAHLKHCGRGWAADRVLPMVLPSGPTGTYSDGLSRTVRAGQRPRRTPPDTVGRICKAGVESSILFVSTGPDLGFQVPRWSKPTSNFGLVQPNYSQGLSWRYHLSPPNTRSMA